MEGQVVVAKVAKKRPVKKANPCKDITVVKTSDGKNFVCALTGLVCPEKAIVTALYPVGAFRNLPALLRHALSNLSGEEYGELKRKLAVEYHQPVEVLLPCGAPSSVPVAATDFARIFQQDEMWAAHTILHGLSVAEFEDLASAKSGASKKAKPEKPAVHSFEIGAYIVKIQRGGEPKSDKADGNVMTASAVKLLHTKHPEGCHVVVVSNGDYTIWAVTPKPETNADDLPEEVKGTVNLLATQLLGALAYGTAVVLSHKKQTFKAQ